MHVTHFCILSEAVPLSVSKLSRRISSDKCEIADQSVAQFAKQADAQSIPHFVSLAPLSTFRLPRPARTTK